MTESNAFSSEKKVDQLIVTVEIGGQVYKSIYPLPPGTEAAVSYDLVEADNSESIKIQIQELPNEVFNQIKSAAESMLGLVQPALKILEEGDFTALKIKHIFVFDIVYQKIDKLSKDHNLDCKIVREIFSSVSNSLIVWMDKALEGELADLVKPNRIID